MKLNYLIQSSNPRTRVYIFVDRSRALIIKSRTRKFKYING